jgi:hypothetical protein
MLREYHIDSFREGVRLAGNLGLGCLVYGAIGIYNFGKDVLAHVFDVEHEHREGDSRHSFRRVEFLSDPIDKD